MSWLVKSLLRVETSHHTSRPGCSSSRLFWVLAGLWFGSELKQDVQQNWPVRWILQHLVAQFTDSRHSHHPFYISQTSNRIFFYKNIWFCLFEEPTAFVSAFLSNPLMTLLWITVNNLYNCVVGHIKALRVLCNKLLERIFFCIQIYFFFFF